MENNTSEKYKLNKIDIYKILRGAAITMVSAVLTYVGQIYLNIDYTFTVNETVVDYGPIAIVVIGAIIEASRRALTNFSDNKSIK